MHEVQGEDMGRRSKRRLKKQKHAVSAPKKKGQWERFHDEHYKTMLFIPFLLALLSIIYMGYLYQTTGNFIIPGISLKGGTSITFSIHTAVDVASFEDELSRTYPGEEFSVRVLQGGGEVTALIVETGLRGEASQGLIAHVGDSLGVTFDADDYTLEEMGSTLGESFFSDLLKTLAFAFLLMGIVVFYYFRNLVPSAAVVFAAMFTILITVGIMNVFGVKLSSAGIAAFLMLLGYSIDTDILLTSRVLKRPKGTNFFEAMIDAMKTGLTMSAAGLSATSIGYFVSESPVIKQIMLILVVGLLCDILTTWVQNAGLLRWYLENKESRGTRK